MTTTSKTITVTKDFAGWKKGDILCAVHFTGYSPGCMVCRELPQRR